MAPKGKKADKLSASQKKSLFWEAIISQKAKDLREALTNTGIEAQTRNDEGLTSFMYAASNNKPQSLEILLDWYQRRKILRQKGWINLQDDNGKTALSIACEKGNNECIQVLIENEATKLDLKDEQGNTARDYCVKANKKGLVQFYDELTKVESESEEELAGGNEANDGETQGLTSTQRSKLKKKKMQLQERNFNDQALEKNDKGDKVRKELDLKKIPKAIWPEVEKIIQSIKELRELKEVSVVRDDVEEDETLKGNFGLDPALFHLIGINRLEIRLADNTLEHIPGNQLQNLYNLQTLILSNNSLTSLPKEIDLLDSLKSLEISYNKLTNLPYMGSLKKLDLINVEHNFLTHVSFTKDLVALSTLNVSNNKVTTLDLDYVNNTRLRVLAAGNNEISSIPREIVFLVSLNELVLSNNNISEIPKEICQLKKLKVFQMEGNEIKDPKVNKLTGNIKDLWKYFKKVGGEDVAVEMPTAEAIQGDGDKVQDTSDSEWDSECSFDITYEEL